jgi:hypothetical protein
MVIPALPPSYVDSFTLEDLVPAAERRRFQAAAAWIPRFPPAKRPLCAHLLPPNIA